MKTGMYILRSRSWLLLLLSLAAMAVYSCGGGGGDNGGGGGGGLPTTPSGLTLQVISSTHIDLSWNASSADAGIASYMVYPTGGTQHWAFGISSSEQNLDPDTLYCFSVSAWDNSGNESSQTSAVCATTLSDPASPWTTVRVGTQADLVTVVSDGTSILVMSDTEEVLMSTDGTGWTSYEPASLLLTGVNDVTWNGNDFVAVDGFLVYTSGDGIAWNMHQTGAAFLDLNGVAWASSLSLHAAVGYESWDDYGVIMTSVDGATWSSATVPSLPDIALRDVAWGGNAFVAVGDSGTILASADGSTWSTVTSPAVAGLSAVAWGDSRFVAVGSNVVVTSPDGASWTLESATPGFLDDIAWSPSLGIFVAVGMNDIRVSDDGVSWSDHSPDDLYLSFNGVTWTGSQFVVVGDGGEILTSPDGTTWTTRYSGDDILNVIWDGSQFVAMGAGSKVMTSDDGETWTYGMNGWGDGSDFFLDMAVSGSLYAIGAQSMIYTTPDLASYPAGFRSLGATSSCNGVLWDGSQFVGVGYSGGGIVWTSPDGGTWTAHFTDPVTVLEDVAYNGSDQYVAVGYGGAIIASADGAIWDTTISSGVGTNLHGVTWSGSLYVAVGSDGTIVTSPDGTTWTVRTSGVSDNLYSVTWTGSDFVAVGWSGTILTSSDGVSWTSYEHTYKTFNGVAWSGTELVIVGDDGIIVKPMP
jgi:hypothetical protein